MELQDILFTPKGDFNLAPILAEFPGGVARLNYVDNENLCSFVGHVYFGEPLHCVTRSLMLLV